MGTHPIFESDFDCLTDRFVDFSNRIIMSASGPNIQLELRLAEMARMNRKEFRNDREPRNRRGSGDDYHRFGGGGSQQQRGMNSRYSKPNNRKPNNIPDRPERESSESELDLKPSRDVEIK